MSSFTIIHKLYGLILRNECRKLEAENSKLTHRVHDILYLKTCRDQKVIPSFLRIKSGYQSSRSPNIMSRASLQLLKDCIRTTYSRKYQTLHEIQYLIKKISNSINPVHWILLCKDLERSTFKISSELEIRHHKKLKKLINNEKHVPAMDPVLNNLEGKPTKIIHNLSDRILTPEEILTLELGLKFAITPNKIPYEGFIYAIESSLKHIDHKAQDEVITDCKRTLYKSRKTSCNLSNTQRNAVNSLKSDSNIIISEADKGGAIVILNRSEYNTKVQIMLTDTKCYQPVKYNPTNRIKSKLKVLLKGTKWDPDFQTKLCMDAPYAPNFYGVPKIHKSGCPLRPVVPTYSAPTYRSAKYLSIILSKLVKNNEYHIKNSQDFIQKLPTKFDEDPTFVLMMLLHFIHRYPY